MIQGKPLAALVLAAVLSVAPVWAQKAAKTTPAAAPTAPTAPSVPPANAPGAKPSMHTGPAIGDILASLKRDLKITDAQTKNWDAFSASVTDGMKTVQSANAGSPAPQGALAIMQSHERFAKARVSSLDGMIAAFKPLYDSLTPEQKATADRLMPQRLGMAM